MTTTLEHRGNGGILAENCARTPATSPARRGSARWIGRRARRDDTGRGESRNNGRRKRSGDAPCETGSSGRVIFARICNLVAVIFTALLVADEVIE